MMTVNTSIERVEALSLRSERMKPYSGDFDQLMRDRDELTRRVAQIAFKKAA